MSKSIGVKIIKGNMILDYVHIKASIQPKMSMISWMRYLKRKSAVMIFERHVNLKCKFGNRNFRAKEYLRIR